jgi:ribosomal protein S18 acetylase RimI-like enzyme
MGNGEQGVGVVIRAARREDWAAIAAIFREGDALHHAGAPEVFGPPLEPARPPAFVEAILADPAQAMLVTAVGGEVVGVIHLYFRERRPPIVAARIAVIESIVVLERAQGQGIGRRLMAAGHALARERGATEVWLDVWSFNEAAIGFYEHLGYREVMQRMRLPLER